MSVGYAWRGEPAGFVEAEDPTAHFEFARRLARLVPAWHADALCRDFDLALWFPAKGERTQPALDICGRCTVRLECLEEAIADPSLDFGIRGGMSANARKARRKVQP